MVKKHNYLQKNTMNYIDGTSSTIKSEWNGTIMKKIMLSLLTISLMGTMVMSVHAADVYEDESMNLYSFDEGITCDDDFATEYQADVSDEKLQQDFELAMQDGIGLGMDDFSEIPCSLNDKEAMRPDNEAEALEADFEVAMQDDSIKLSEAGIESMNLIATNDYNIDTEYAAEVNDYESKPILTRAASTVSRVEYGRQWRIYRKSDNATMVQWVLRGLFLYNGKTSQCKQTSMNCYNNASNTFTVTSKSHYASGMYAIGNCRAVQKKTGKAYSQLLRIGVTPTGKVVK